MSNDIEAPLLTLWSKIELLFKKWRWRIFYFAYIALALCFYIWVMRGNDFPRAAEVLLWAAPILVGFALRILVDTHLQITAFLEPETVKQKECVELLLKRLRKTARTKHTPGKPITLDFLGVSLHYSHEWLQNEFKDFMNEFPAISVELRIVFVDPSTLAQFSFDTEPVDWASESRERAEWVRSKLMSYANHSQGRLRLRVRTITNLPHWHGILVERRYLFLGRVSWTDGTERSRVRPSRLTCAQNGYRYFTNDDRHHGEERVSLFRRWMAHYLYGNHDGKLIVDTISGGDQ